jgi:hypothetical protein
VSQAGGDGKEIIVIRLVSNVNEFTHSEGNMKGFQVKTEIVNCVL